MLWGRAVNLGFTVVHRIPNPLDATAGHTPKKKNGQPHSMSVWAKSPCGKHVLLEISVPWVSALRILCISLARVVLCTATVGLTIGLWISNPLDTLTSDASIGDMSEPTVRPRPVNDLLV